MIVYLVLVTLTCCSYITCWVEKPRLAAEQEEKRSVSEKQQVFHKVWIKALWILQKISLCFMSELRCYEYVQVLHFLYQLAQIKQCKKKKSSNVCVKSAEMHLVQRESLTSLLHVDQRPCQLRKWVFHPADASCLGTLSSAHPAAASRGSGSAHRSRKKRSLKNSGI